MRRLASILRASGWSLLLLLSSAHAVWAQGSTGEQAERAQEISRTTMSPFCPGRTLEACPSPYAGEWRDDIRSWVAEGLSTEEIRERLKQRMPDKDLTGAPSTALDSVLPVLVTIVAVLLLVLLLRILVRPKPRIVQPKPSQRGSDASEPALDSRLDEELAQLDD